MKFGAFIQRDYHQTLPPSRAYRVPAAADGSVRQLALKPITRLRIGWIRGKLLRKSLSSRDLCSSRPSRISTTFCGKRPAAPRSWTTPSRPRGCCSSSISTTLSEPTSRGPSFRARNTTSIIDRRAPLVGLGRAEETDGTFDHDKALTGDDLIKYVDDELFPYLKGFRTRAEGANTIEYKIGEIFCRDRKQVPQRLFAARRAGAGRSAELPLAAGEARAVASLRGQAPQHGQCRAQRRRVLHAAPAHPRHDPGGQAADRRAHLRRRLRLVRLPLRVVRVSDAATATSFRPRTSTRSRPRPSTPRRRRASPTSSAS